MTAGRRERGLRSAADGGSEGTHPTPHCRVPTPGRPSLAGAVLYYTAASLRNRLRAQLRRLRSPRALVALVAGAGYVYWFLVRPVHRDGASVAADAGLVTGAWAPPLAALALTGLAAAWWLARPASGDGRGAAGGGPSRALAFTPAEEHLLFPAPISRRGLVRWKLWRAQLGILLNTLVWTVVLRGAGGEPAAWRRAGAFWVLLSVVFLHRVGAALATGGWRARAAADGNAGQGDAADDADPAPSVLDRLHGFAPALVFAGVAGALLASAVHEQARLAAAWDAGLPSFFAAVGTVLGHPAARAALWPARLVVDPLFAAQAGAAPWARALAPAVGVLALHFLWVLRTDAAVQELALAAGARRRARTGTQGAGAGSADPLTTPAVARRGRRAVRRRRAPALAPTGVPAVALVWKNLVAATRAVALARLLALYAVTAAGVLVVAARTPRLAELAGVVAGVWAAMLVLVGPTWVRVDLRHDLPHLAFLRAAPLSGRDVMAAELAASTFALTALQLAAFALLLLASLGARDGFGMTGEERLAGGLAVALALPGVNAALLTVQNAAALLFPAWVRAPGASRGIEAMGQNLVLTGLTLAAAAVVLAPAAGLAAATSWGVARAAGGAAGPWAWVPGAIVGTLASLAALAPVVGWLGRVFDRTDPPATDAGA